MKMMCWNVRGLENPRNVYRLQHMLKFYNPHLVFFMETKVSVSRMERIRMKCGFVGGIDVGAAGSKGGLSVGWREGCLVNLRSYSKDFIDVDIQENVGSPIWRWTGFYGSPYIRDGRRTWDLLRTLGNNQNMPWLVSGDFNEIQYDHEKKGEFSREE